MLKRKVWLQPRHERSALARSTPTQSGEAGRNLASPGASVTPSRGKPGATSSLGLASGSLGNFEDRGWLGDFADGLACGALLCGIVCLILMFGGG